MNNSKQEVSELDKKYYELLRQDVSDFMARGGKAYDGDGVRVLDIAPQDHEGAKPYFAKSTVETLDIDSKSGATYVADICEDNSATIPAANFNVVVCTEVLEHTLQPFDAVKEIKRILKPGGVALVSVPYNFRIHGPLPDCWRFTEHGLRALFKDFEIVSLESLDDEDRFLAPIHYTVVVRK
jgi:SAM-dependent methyltransferase